MQFQHLLFYTGTVEMCCRALFGSALNLALGCCSSSTKFTQKMQQLDCICVQRRAGDEEENVERTTIFCTRDQAEGSPEDDDEVNFDTQSIGRPNQTQGSSFYRLLVCVPFWPTRLKNLVIARNRVKINKFRFRNYRYL